MKLMCIRGSLITCILFMSRQRVVKNVYEIDVHLIIRFNSEAFLECATQSDITSEFV